MASLGHVAVGFAVARSQQARPTTGALVGAMVFYASLALLPDLDVIGFRFHVPYSAPFGHRGAFHSLTFAVLAGAVVGAVQGVRGKPWISAALLAGAVVATHGLLDAMTDGGLGVALFWPFTDQRYFLPWRPIPVAPIGQRFLSEQGLFVGLTELLLFSPLFLYAFWPRLKPKHVQ
jgi:inner membrane protein